jgi:hypothetical protein
MAQNLGARATARTPEGAGRRDAADEPVVGQALMRMSFLLTNTTLP